LNLGGDTDCFVSMGFLSTGKFRDCTRLFDRRMFLFLCDVFFVVLMNTTATG
jgi:hypothetical protein